MKFFELICGNCLEESPNNELFHSAFRVRYKVYHDEMGVIPENPEKELHDKFDFTGTSHLFLAVFRNEAIGTIRLTKYSETHKLPLFQDFDKNLPELMDFSQDLLRGRKFAEVSRFTVLKDFRSGKGFIPHVLTCLMFETCVEEGITDLLIIANPSQKRLYENAGFSSFAYKEDSLTGIRSPVMHARTDDGFRKFIKDLKYKLMKRGVFHEPGKIRKLLVNL